MPESTPIAIKPSEAPKTSVLYWRNFVKAPAAQAPVANAYSWSAQPHETLTTTTGIVSELACLIRSQFNMDGAEASVSGSAPAKSEDEERCDVTKEGQRILGASKPANARIKFRYSTEE
ncbi:uncharacterized protein UDID_17030 [Ustilago sp. UG-2017a]|nr:uncharacterized protein UDID_17030 [Ustilago sp. UG-2017a]